MGMRAWLQRLLGRAPSGGFVVFDVETSGLVPARDRIVEIALVRVDRSGRIVDEWTTLLNPGGPVGPSNIHHITPADVRHAPRFADLVGEINNRLAGRVLVAHNARFDLAFLQTEYARAGWDLPPAPYLCTLEASWHYLPDLTRRRLVECCWEAGVTLHDAHSALGDAHATAELLGFYLRRARPDHRALPTFAATVTWPAVPRGGEAPRLRPKVRSTPIPAPPGRLWALLDDLPLAAAVDEGAPLVSTAYLEKLYEVLEDGVLTEDEAQSLVDVARIYELARPQVDAAHRGFLLALAHRIVEDGRVSRDERHDLEELCTVLGYADDAPRQILDVAWAEIKALRSKDLQPLPPGWTLGEPLRVGDGVAFTGCDQLVRARLEGRAQSIGLRVTGSVSRITRVLVTDDPATTTTKARAAREYGTRVVSPDVFAELVAHIQPALPVVPAPRPPVGPPPPSVVRAWAAANGLPIGVRGQIPAETLAAYRAQLTSATVDTL